MKRFSYLTLILSFLVLQGCRNPSTGTNNNSSGWNEATAHAPWAARYGLAGASFGNNMWVIGGASGSGAVTNYYGDVWKSSDGKNWSQTATPGFGGRYEGQVLAFNNQLFLIGGNNNGTLMNDVWSSPDGVTWTKILAFNNAIGANVVGGTQFCPREDFAAVVFNNLMWVIGGTPNPSNTTSSIGLNDVWNSADGVTWNQVATNSGAAGRFSQRWGLAAAGYNGNIYVMCGHNSGTGVNTIDSDVWSSPDGANWTSLGNTFIPVYYHQLVVNNNAMWFTCGYAPWEGGPFAAIDSSTNGINWPNAGTTTLTGRFGHLSLSFNNKVWIIGGCNNTDSLTYFNDVWYSP